MLLDTLDPEVDTFVLVRTARTAEPCFLAPASRLVLSRMVDLPEDDCLSNNGRSVESVPPSALPSLSLDREAVRSREVDLTRDVRTSPEYWLP